MVREMTIDPVVLSTAMPCALRLKVVGAMLDALSRVEQKKKVNWGYFAHLDIYAGRETSLREVAPCHSLWPPATAALDYIVRMEPLDTKILDFACGLGNLLAYLAHNGYKDVWGFDTWAQLPKSATECFLENFGLEDRLLDESPVGFFNALVFTGGHWNWFTEAQRELLLPALKTLIVDSAYGPKELAGFDLAYSYGGLIRVFKKRETE